MFSAEEAVLNMEIEAALPSEVNRRELHLVQITHLSSTTGFVNEWKRAMAAATLRPTVLAAAM